MAELTDSRETVRERYANAAKAAGAGAYDQAQMLESEAGCCGGDGASCRRADATGVFGASLYDEAAREEVPEAAVSASLGCGVLTAVAGDLCPVPARQCSTWARAPVPTC